MGLKTSPDIGCSHTANIPGKKAHIGESKLEKSSFTGSCYSLGKSQGSDLKYRKGIPGMLERLEPLLEYNAILSFGYKDIMNKNQKNKDQVEKRMPTIKDWLTNYMPSFWKMQKWKKKSRETFSSL